MHCAFLWHKGQSMEWAAGNKQWENQIKYILFIDLFIMHGTCPYYSHENDAEEFPINALHSTWMCSDNGRSDAARKNL